MSFIKNILRVGAFCLAIIATAALPTKKAHADGGAVAAGIAGGAHPWSGSRIGRSSGE